MKIAEVWYTLNVMRKQVSSDGRKARILLTLQAAVEIKDKLKDLIDVLEEIKSNDESSGAQNSDANKNTDSQPSNSLIKSHIVNYPYRRYFLDLKRNRRGHFLRLTMLSTLNRIQLAIPSQGMLDLYNAINDMLGKWWDGSEANDSKCMFRNFFLLLPHIKLLVYRSQSP